MWLRLGIVMGIVLLTMGAAGTWIFLNQDKVYGSAELAEADPAADPELPTAERDLGRLTGHFRDAPVPADQKGRWSFW